MTLWKTPPTKKEKLKPFRFLSLLQCWFPEICTAHKDWWTVLELVDTEMSLVPSQTVLWMGPSAFSPPWPCPPAHCSHLPSTGAFWQNVWWRWPWGRGLVLLNQNAIASLKTFHPTTVEGLPGPHLQQVDGVCFPRPLSEARGPGRAFHNQVQWPWNLHFCHLSHTYGCFSHGSQELPFQRGFWESKVSTEWI